MKVKLIYLLLSVFLVLFISGCGSEFSDDEYADVENADDADDDAIVEDDVEDEEIDEPEADDVVSPSQVTSEMELPEIFVKQTAVFGIPIIATEKMSDAQVLHTANVMAQYLDNDENGQPDDPALVDTLIQQQAVMLVMFDENELDQFDPEMLPNPERAQVVFDADIYPGGAAVGEFDATLEEVLHLISFAGLAETYPDVFGEYPGTAVADAMDVARGGQFFEIPDAYPAGAWYTYDDETCEYECMISEYVYWAFTSILGAQDYNGRLDEIGHEWPLNTRAKVQTQDLAIYAILTDPAYKLATVLPDGNYDAQQFIVER